MSRDLRRHPIFLLSGVVPLILLACSRMTPSPPDSASAPSSQAPAPTDSPNRELLDEINVAGTWVHVRKTKAIQARRLERDETVTTLEGPVQAKAGDFLCRGEAGELWPQSAESLEKRYIATGDVTSDGWRVYAPQPDAEGALAAPVTHAFSVVATWGKLHGKAGDYVLKQFSDRGEPYPLDVWIVDQALFRATYAPAAPLK